LCYFDGTGFAQGQGGYMAQLPLDWVSSWSFDSDDTQPLYQQLYDYLRDGILSGRLAGGLRLLGTRALAKQTGLARNTVLAAYEQLQAEGFLKARSGSGFVVCEGLEDRLQWPVTQTDTPDPVMPALAKRGSEIASGIRKGVNHLRLPLQPGEPDCSLFPMETWAMLAGRELRRAKRTDLTYGDPQGEYRLRQALSLYLSANRGVSAKPEQILITSGAQQALDLCFRLLLDPGDQVLLEDPGYTGCRGAAQVAGGFLVPLNVDDSGAQVPSETLPRARLVYLTPSHQYPCGITMSLKRRLDWLDWSAREQAWILEDDYDSEFRYDHKPLAAIQGLSSVSRESVLYMGTFSKVMFPSLRMGYLVLPERVIPAFVKLRGFCDTQPATLPQRVLAAFMEEGKFAGHIRKMRQIYAERRNLVLEFAESSFRPFFNWQNHPAGMHMTLFAKQPNWDDRSFAERLREIGVGARALSDYAIESDLRGLVVGYAGHDEGLLSVGLEKLNTLLRSD
jgi:GntR family transcriptional regulator/MocR family aminotransferase